MTTSAAPKLPAYQRLKHHDGDEENGSVGEDYYDFEKERMMVMKPSRNSSIGWYRIRSKLVPSVSLRRRRLRLRRRVVSLRRLLLLRRKLKLICDHFRISCAKVVKRFKEGQSNFGDLFAGNYMFLQINPSSLKCLDHRPNNHTGVGGEQKQHQLQIQTFPSRTIGMGYTFPRI